MVSLLDSRPLLFLSDRAQLAHREAAFVLTGFVLVLLDVEGLVFAVVIRGIIARNRLHAAERSQLAIILLIRLFVPRLVVLHVRAHRAVVPLGLRRLLILVVVPHILVLLQMLFRAIPYIWVIYPVFWEQLYVFLFRCIIDILLFIDWIGVYQRHSADLYWCLVHGVASADERLRHLIWWGYYLDVCLRVWRLPVFDTNLLLRARMFLIILILALIKSSLQITHILIDCGYFLVLLLV